MTKLLWVRDEKEHLLSSYDTADDVVAKIREAL
jgi:hypothetical protein